MCKKNDEKRIWKDENTTDEWKRKNLEEIQKRMAGWQLESFKESYKFKAENGISIIKQKKLIMKSSLVIIIYIIGIVIGALFLDIWELKQT